jgi:hypothetical protein
VTKKNSFVSSATAEFKIPEFGSYFNADAFESSSQFASASATSYPSAASEPDNELEFDEPKKIPEIEVYYKPLPSQPEPETITYKPVEEFTPGPVYYKPFPAEPVSDPVRSFLKRKADHKLDVSSRPRLDVQSRSAPAAPAVRPRPKAETETKRKSNKPEFFGGFEDRNSDFGDFGGSDLWDKFEQEWGQKVSK